jgi:serine/threonine-protein kinase HipA
MEHLLRVSNNGDTVGHLGFDSREDRYSFQYEQAWRERRTAFSLSPHILHTGEAPAAGAVHRFLGNLLPEGRALEVASVMYQMSKDNIFGLIRMLGKEPVGALSFAHFEESQEPPAHQEEPIRREIPYEELSERIRERDTIPFPVWDQKVRLSVAGYQDKLQVMVEGSKLSLADGSLSSTHILKPESRNANTPFMVANEHYCMTLADAIGLRTAAVSIRRIPEPILLIKRFDRVVRTAADNPDQIESVGRLHIIDGCQALDLPSQFKYERNFGHTQDVRNIREGVSFEKLFSLQPHFEQPAQTRTFMLRWAILQLLIGNSDAHGKNISFFQRRIRIEPAPLYDLVSVNAYTDNENVEQEMAMAYGDAFLLEEITPFELALFAKSTGTRPALLARELIRMASAALKFAPVLAESEVYVGDDERARVKKISDFICVQADRLMKLAPQVPKVNPDLL